MNHKYISAFIITALLFTVACSAGAAENLLQNPGFESGEGVALPEPWDISGGDNPRMGREITGDAHSGERAILITDESGEARDTEHGSGIVQTVPAGAGQYYRASCWVKCLERDQRNAAWLQLRFEPSGERYSTHLNTTDNEVWERFVALGRAPEGTDAVRVYIKTLHWATSRYVVDDFSLEAVEVSDQQFPLMKDYGSEGLQEVRELNLHTPIVENGQTVSHICVPEGEAWSKLGRKLSEGIREKTGATVPIIEAGENALASDETTIAIGSLNNNFILERMWLNRYQRVDALHPGPGAYILQTIPEPYDCPEGKNVLIVGASDLEGARAGVEALLEMLEEGETLSIDEWILEVSNNTPMSEDRRQELLEQDFSKYWLKDFWQAALKYQQTGDLAYAMRTRKILLAQAQRYVDYAKDEDADVTDYWPAPTSSRSHRIYWPEETTSEWIGAMWDFIEECPVFSDEDRATCSNALLLTLYDLPRHVHGWGSLADKETTEPLQFNHTTYPVLGIYFLARYFDRFYSDVDTHTIDDLMNRSHNCFRAQMGSWKAQEDATGYYSTVPGHTIIYSLAEGDYSYFDSGRVKTLCDYTMAICDNAGDPASFGDSGYGRGIYTRNLEWAVWYYHDANMLWWLQHVTGQRGSKWKNPYKDMEPQPWEEMVGITPFQLSRSVYDFTKSYTYYGGEHEPPNVPYEKSFDKISFRENLDPNGQFFLLDGYARGGHLHYDGNAINKFYADGEDWLMDGDYLVRNTTDHNMLSLTKDGRCDEYEPPCAALEHLADLPLAKCTQTSVYDYNGANWDRNILWLPGDFVCLVDRVEAAEPGEFNCEIIFKMIDRGQVGSDRQRMLSIRRMAGGKPGKFGLSVVNNPTENVEVAVKFTENFARMDFPVTLPEGGPYRVHIVGYGIDGGTDSFWVQADGGDKTAFHLPLGKFSRSYDSGVNPKEGSPPKMSIESGEHLMTITLRESPNVMLDRVEFVDDEGTLVKAVEAENAPEVPEAMLADAPPDRLFYIKNDGHSRFVQSTRLNHTRTPIRYAHHKFGDVLKKGEAVSNQAIFFNTNAAENADFDLRRLNQDACMITENREPLGFFFTAPGSIDLPAQLATDAPMGYLSEDAIALCDASRAGAISADVP
ncbi:MAG: hypothetical protein R6V19_11745, partial [Armatimonadota bacterium]